MNDLVLQHFRNTAAQMAGPAPQDWEWIGVHMSQRMICISEERAKEYAARYGGVAKKMES